MIHIEIPDAVCICPRCDSLATEKVCDTCMEIREAACKFAAIMLSQGVQSLQVTEGPYWETPRGKLWLETFTSELQRLRVAWLNANLPTHQFGVGSRRGPVAPPKPRITGEQIVFTVCALAALVWLVIR